ncbi:MAG: hypothetical protein Satyrvirus19_11 [Satyrvirus sp.]|uniref:Uncharacterized protein n=1 Tax=Satyrvirus sp. TaxID=2487771 RepID=A0A3G5AJ86_9VIRU|nr:MAG: hypothetical protein Satyrvirus19_11 [Satyrvirus sp.]
MAKSGKKSSKKALPVSSDSEDERLNDKPTNDKTDKTDKTDKKNSKKALPVSSDSEDERLSDKPVNEKSGKSVDKPEKSNDKTNKTVDKPNEKFNSDVSSENPNKFEEKKNPIYRFKQIDFDKIVIDPSKKDSLQFVYFMNYNDQKVNAKTRIYLQTDDYMKITTHGIPRLSDEKSVTNYYSDDSKREFIKIPLDDEQEGCVKFRKYLMELDKWASSEKTKMILFGKKNADKYQYVSCIKTPHPIEDDNNNKKGKNKDKKEFPIVDYVKAKFSMKTTDDKKRVNMSKLYRMQGNKKVEITAITVTDIAKEITFLSDVKYILYHYKIWANKTSAAPGVPRQYGIGFKVIAFQYIPHISNSLNTDVDFMSSDDDETPKTKNVSKPVQKLDDDDDEVNKKDKLMKDKQSQSKDKPSKEMKEMKKNESDDEDDEDEVPETKPSKKESVDKKPNKKSSKSDDEDEDDDDVPVSKTSKTSKKESADKKPNKKSSKSDDEDEEDDDEDDIPVSKASKTSKKESNKKPNKKMASSDEEDEDEEEEIKPKKKSSTTKGKSSSKSR